MLKTLENIINTKYSQFTNKSLCDLGCPPSREDSYTCNKPEFQVKNFINIEAIHKSLKLSVLKLKICDGINLNISKNSVLFVEITAPYTTPQKKFDQIVAEFEEKIDGTKQTIHKLLNQNFNGLIEFRGIFKNKQPINKKIYSGMKYYSDFDMIIGSISVSNIKKLAPLLCE